MQPLSTSWHHPLQHQKLTLTPLMPLNIFSTNIPGSSGRDHRLSSGTGQGFCSQASAGWSKGDFSIMISNCSTSRWSMFMMMKVCLSDVREPVGLATKAEFQVYWDFLSEWNDGMTISLLLTFFFSLQLLIVSFISQNAEWHFDSYSNMDEGLVWSHLRLVLSSWYFVQEKFGSDRVHFVRWLFFLLLVLVLLLTGIGLGI